MCSEQNCWKLLLNEAMQKAFPLDSFLLLFSEQLWFHHPAQLMFALKIIQDQQNKRWCNQFLFNSEDMCKGFRCFVWVFVRLNVKHVVETRNLKCEWHTFCHGRNFAVYGGTAGTTVMVSCPVKFGSFLQQVWFQWSNCDVEACYSFGDGKWKGTSCEARWHQIYPSSLWNMDKIIISWSFELFAAILKRISYIFFLVYWCEATIWDSELCLGAQT